MFESSPTHRIFSNKPPSPPVLATPPSNRTVPRSTCQQPSFTTAPFAQATSPLALAVRPQALAILPASVTSIPSEQQLSPLKDLDLEVEDIRSELNSIRVEEISPAVNQTREPHPLATPHNRGMLTEATPVMSLPGNGRMALRACLSLPPPNTSPMGSNSPPSPSSTSSASSVSGGQSPVLRQKQEVRRTVSSEPAVREGDVIVAMVIAELLDSERAYVRDLRDTTEVRRVNAHL